MGGRSDVTNREDRSMGRVSLGGGKAIDAVAVTPNDSTDLPDGVSEGLYVGMAGDIALILEDMSTSIIFKDLAAGVVHPLKVKRVLDTGTDATDIIAIY